MAGELPFAPMTPGQTVTAFIAAMSAKDLDGGCALLDENVHYDNVPMSKVDGREAARAVLDPFLAGASEVDWVVHRQAETGPLVLNERTDRFLLPGGWLEIPVAGVFEVHGGLITLWRDFFDLQTVTDGLAKVGTST